MQWPHWVTAADRNPFLAACVRPHLFKTEVDILDLEENVISSISPLFTDGQINILHPDDPAGVTRTATMTFTDPDYGLQVDSSSPSAGAIYADRMLRIRQSVWALGRWGEVVGFVGELAKCDRTGDEVAVEGHGKEAFMRRGKKQFTAKKNTPIADVIYDGARRYGERRFTGSFGSGITERLTEDVVVDEVEEKFYPWMVYTSLAQSRGYELFYTADGALALEEPSTVPVATFGDLDVTSDVQVTEDFTRFRNRVLVIGKGTVRGFAELDPRHELSAEKLARHGDDGYRTEVIRDDKIAKTTGANDRAAAELRKLSRLEREVTFNTGLLLHGLDKWDTGRVDTTGAHGYTGNFVGKVASLPLGGGGGEGTSPEQGAVATIGYTAQVSDPGRVIRVA